MSSLWRTRLTQVHRTSRFPQAVAPLPERFRGRPTLDEQACRIGCSACADSCPTRAISLAPLRIDTGACVFCPICEEQCPSGAIRFGRDHRLATRHRLELVRDSREATPLSPLDADMRRLLGRSLRLRQVSAGGCGACEAEINVLGTIVFDLGRFGIDIVASPRHADGIVITGPVTDNMEFALREAYAAVPPPKIVVAVGACAIAGGPYAGADRVRGSVPEDIPVDLYVPGCPPHPLTILDGLLRLLGRMPDPRTA